MPESHTPAANYSRVIAKTKIPTKRGHFRLSKNSGLIRGRSPLCLIRL